MTTRQTDPGGGLAARIREARESADLSQRELAALVGVSGTTVARWERGETAPDSEQLTGIALHCGTDALELEGFDGRGRVAPMSRNERMRALLGAIARHWAERGYAPTMQELMDETGFSSKSVVKSWLHRCEAAGLIVRAPGVARAITLTEAGRAFAKAPLETGGLPVRREEITPGAPRTVALPAARPATASTDTRPPPSLRVPRAGPRPVQRTTTARGADRADGMGARIREALRVEGLTQAELAALVGVSPHTVWCWEAGRVRPIYERRVAIAFHCGTDVGALEGRASSRWERLEQVVAAFRDAIAHLPEEDIDFICTFVRLRRWRLRGRRRAGE